MSLYFLIGLNPRDSISPTNSVSDKDDRVYLGNTPIMIRCCEVSHCTTKVATHAMTDLQHCQHVQIYDKEKLPNKSQTRTIYPQDHFRQSQMANVGKSQSSKEQINGLFTIPPLIVAENPC